MLLAVRRAVGTGAVVLLASMAMAQVHLTLRGTIENVGGQTLVVKERSGMITNVKLADDVHVYMLKKAPLANVKQGSVVGVTARQEMNGSPKSWKSISFPTNLGTSRALEQKLSRRARSWAISTARF